MLAAAAATWRKATRDAISPRTGLSRTSCPALRLARVLTAGLLVGAMTGFFGVGGGFLIVPTLAVALAFSLRMAVGTSLVIITATSLMALSADLAAGRTLDVGVTVAMTLSAIAPGSVRDRPHSGRTSQSLEMIGDQEPKIERHARSTRVATGFTTSRSPRRSWLSTGRRRGRRLSADRAGGISSQWPKRG